MNGGESVGVYDKIVSEADSRQILDWPNFPPRNLGSSSSHMTFGTRPRSSADQRMLAGQKVSGQKSKGQKIGGSEFTAGQEIADLEAMNFRLERKSAFLVRKIRKLQLLHTKSHVIKQLGYLLLDPRSGNAPKVVQTASGEQKPVPIVSLGGTVEAKRKLLLEGMWTNADWSEKTSNLFRSGQFKSDWFKCDELKRMSPQMLARLLQKYSQNRKLIDLLIKFDQPNLITSYSCGGGRSNAPEKPPIEGASAANNQSQSSALSLFSSLSKDDARNLGTVASVFENRLKANFRCQGYEIDFDETESSSGGESCDEEEIFVEKYATQFPSKRNKHPTLENRASYRWRLERAFIGSRVSYIRAQIGDLENKIRQHAELYRQVRLRKLQANSKPAQNSQLGGANLVKSFLDQSARTLPYENKTRSRFVKTPGMYKWNRKTARQSSVRCNCFWPWTSCTLCGGRPSHQYRNSATVNNQPDLCTQTRDERVACIDYSYHPNLCENKGRDITLPLKLEAFWKQETYAAKSFAEDALKPLRKFLMAGKDQSQKQKADGLKFSKKQLPKKTLKTLQPIKKQLLKKKRRGRRRLSDVSDWSSASGGSALVGGAISSIGEPDSSADDDTDQSESSSFTNELYNSHVTIGTSGLGVSGSSSFNYSSSTNQKSRRSIYSTYDIDNIIIDPSVAAVTRVEKLQYKEIVTPGWREKEFEPKKEEDNADDKNLPIEDVTDEVYLNRHKDKEFLEHNRFLVSKRRPE